MTIWSYLKIWTKKIILYSILPIFFLHQFIPFKVRKKKKKKEKEEGKYVYKMISPKIKKVDGKNKKRIFVNSTVRIDFY